MAIINRVDTYTCRVPLDHPIRFKWNTIEHRDYTVVRIESVDGIVGSAIGLSRTSPIDMAIHDLVAPVAMGSDAMEVGEFHERLRKQTAASHQHGILAPARSLVDIAMWDIRGKLLDAPVWKLLGGSSEPSDVLLVEGYELPGESDEEFARRLARRVEEGYRILKLEAAGYDDPEILKRRLELIRRYAGNDVKLVVDVNGAWSSIREATRVIRLIKDADLSWVEDPFPQHRIQDVGKLRREVNVPLGAGDDLTSPRELISLVCADAVDVLRVDVTTLGGFTAATDVIGVARQYEIPVSTHAHPAIHQHLAFAWPAIQHIEVFPDSLPFEPSHKLVTDPVFPRIQGGKLSAPEEPGVGLTLNMEVVEQTALRHQTFE